MSTFFIGIFLVCGVPVNEFGPVTGCYHQRSNQLFAEAEQCQIWIRNNTVPGRTFYGHSGGVVTDKACVMIHSS